MKKLLQIIAASLGLTSCAMKPSPGAPLHAVRFAQRPHIVQRGDAFFLRYQIDAKPGDLTMVVVLVAKKTPTKAFYYFSSPISHQEKGRPVDRPLEKDGFTDYARRDAVYWLDPDGTETHLEIRREDAPGP